ncbi:MAG: hypothetical protein COB15_09195 [Flavobacteriales bacterium]|nr:MAG: hypothetical protein COB15_09195 [Flavobacteriales bacterium]
MLQYKKNISPNQRFQFAYFQVLDHFLGRAIGFKITKKTRKKFYERLYEELKSKGEGKTIEVERVKNISEKEFKEKYLNLNIPVILDGAAKNWKCVREWDFDYFIEKHGSDSIKVVDDIQMNATGEVERSFYTSNLKSELNNIKEGKGNYYRFYPVMNRHPEHLKDIDESFFKARIEWFSTFKAYQVFFGGKGSITNFHTANASNFFTQIMGEKEWYLYPVYYSPIIDPSPTDGMSRGAPIRTKEGPFNPFEPNFNNPYHIYKYIDIYHMVLKPGDIFFNPPYYWHAIKNNSESIGMGFRWIAPKSIFKVSKLYFMLDFFSKIWIKAFQAYRDINEMHAKDAKKL